MRGTPVIRSTVEDQQFAVLQLMRRLFRHPTSTPTHAQIVGLGSDGRIQPLKVKARLINIRSERYIVVTGNPAPTKYLFESTETVEEAIKVWHDFIWENSIGLSKIMHNSYRFEMTDPDIVVFADHSKGIWRIGDIESKAGMTLTPQTGAEWVQFWRGEEDTLKKIRERSNDNSAQFLFSTELYRFTGRWFDHVLEDAGISTEPITPTPAPRVSTT
jgi:hypothetical protein